MSAAAKHAAYDPSGLDVLEFALAQSRAGRSAAIATQAKLHGASPRKCGAQIAVSETGEFIGSISSGCLERAIIDEALASLERGAGAMVRYGAGSRFLDIVLPCGSGIDILYSAPLQAEPFHRTVESLRARRPADLVFSPRGADAWDQQITPCTDAAVYLRRYLPPLRVAVAGLGVEVSIFARLAAAAGYSVVALSSDPETLARCPGERLRLRSAASLEGLHLDPWTAFVSLYHERDWELPLLMHALKSEAFYIGAVGSPKTQAARLAALREAGAPDALTARLRGPIGLIPSTRDPSALAISVLAEIVARWPHA